ncbi:MAG: heterodisulfide reductase-related iron-sulfur binding cluster, partial [Negativibacillus sp.]
FPPCPDRASRELLGHIRPFLASDPVVFEQIQCCGLGGCAGGKEAKLARQMGQQAAEASLESGRRLMTYCASCAGNFARNGCPDTGHILLRILEIQEQPQIKMSVINRAKTKYWRG